MSRRVVVLAVVVLAGVASAGLYVRARSERSEVQRTAAELARERAAAEAARLEAVIEASRREAEAEQRALEAARRAAEEAGLGDYPTPRRPPAPPWDPSADGRPRDR